MILFDGRGERAVLAVIVGMATAAAMVSGFVVVEMRAKDVEMIADVVVYEFWY